MVLMLLKLSRSINRRQRSEAMTPRPFAEEGRGQNDTLVPRCIFQEGSWVMKATMPLRIIMTAMAASSRLAILDMVRDPALPKKL